MPRRRYPSDEARVKTKPGVRVHYSIRNHPRFAKVWADPDMRGIVLGLWMIAGEHHAGKTGDTVTLHRGDLSWISGRTHAGHALSRVRAACELMGYTLRVDGEVVHVHVRNFARKQGFGSARRGATPRTPPPSESESESESEEEGNAPELAESIKTWGPPAELQERIAEKKPSGQDWTPRFLAALWELDREKFVEVHTQRRSKDLARCWTNWVTRSRFGHDDFQRAMSHANTAEYAELDRRDAEANAKPVPPEILSLISHAGGKR